MTIAEAIKLAIEGGYELFDSGPVTISTNTWPMVFAKKVGTDKLWPLSGVLLDPSFWKCLGKAMGWYKEGQICVSGDGCFEGQRGATHEGACVFTNFRPQWQVKWHDFIDHLAEGKTAEDYFKSL